MSSIKELFKDFEIPVAYLDYDGKSQNYIVYTDISEVSHLETDNEIKYTKIKYDFDIYTKGNPIDIIKKLKQVLKENDFKYVNTVYSAYDRSTEQYKKTLEYIFINYEEE